MIICWSSLALEDAIDQSGVTRICPFRHSRAACPRTCRTRRLATVGSKLDKGTADHLVRRTGGTGDVTGPAYEKMVGAGQITVQVARKITSPEILNLLVGAKLVVQSHESEDARLQARQQEGGHGWSGTGRRSAAGLWSGGTSRFTDGGCGSAGA